MIKMSDTAYNRASGFGLCPHQNPCLTAGLHSDISRTLYASVKNMYGTPIDTRAKGYEHMLKKAD